MGGGEVRRLMLDKGISKGPGYSWIEVDGMVHVFLAGDKSNRECDDVHKMLHGIHNQMKQGS